MPEIISGQPEISREGLATSLFERFPSEVAFMAYLAERVRALPEEDMSVKVSQLFFRLLSRSVDGALSFIEQVGTGLLLKDKNLLSHILGTRHNSFSKKIKDAAADVVRDSDDEKERERAEELWIGLEVVLSDAKYAAGHVKMPLTRTAQSLAELGEEGTEKGKFFGDVQPIFDEIDDYYAEVLRSRRPKFAPIAKGEQTKDKRSRGIKTGEETLASLEYALEPEMSRDLLIQNFIIPATPDFDKRLRAYFDEHIAPDPQFLAHYKSFEKWRNRIVKGMPQSLTMPEEIVESILREKGVKDTELLAWSGARDGERGRLTEDVARGILKKLNIDFSDAREQKKFDESYSGIWMRYYELLRTGAFRELKKEITKVLGDNLELHYDETENRWIVRDKPQDEESEEVETETTDSRDMWDFEEDEVSRVKLTKEETVLEVGGTGPLRYILTKHSGSGNVYLHVGSAMVMLGMERPVKIISTGEKGIFAGLHDGTIIAIDAQNEPIIQHRITAHPRIYAIERMVADTRDDSVIVPAVTANARDGIVWYKIELDNAGASQTSLTAIDRTFAPPDTTNFMLPLRLQAGTQGDTVNILRDNDDGRPFIQGAPDLARHYMPELHGTVLWQNDRYFLLKNDVAELGTDHALQSFTDNGVGKIDDTACQEFRYEIERGQLEQSAVFSYERGKGRTYLRGFSQAGAFRFAIPGNLFFSNYFEFENEDGLLAVGVSFVDKEHRTLRTFVQEGDALVDKGFETRAFSRIRGIEENETRIVGGEPVHIGRSPFGGEMITRDDGEQLFRSEGKILDVKERNGYLNITVEKEGEVVHYTKKLVGKKEREAVVSRKEGEQFPPIDSFYKTEYDLSAGENVSEINGEGDAVCFVAKRFNKDSGKIFSCMFTKGNALGFREGGTPQGVTVVGKYVCYGLESGLYFWDTETGQVKRVSKDVYSGTSIRKISDNEIVVEAALDFGREVSYKRYVFGSTGFALKDEKTHIVGDGLLKDEDEKNFVFLNNGSEVLLKKNTKNHWLLTLDGRALEGVEKQENMDSVLWTDGESFVVQIGKNVLIVGKKEADGEYGSSIHGYAGISVPVLSAYRELRSNVYVGTSETYRKEVLGFSEIGSFKETLKDNYEDIKWFEFENKEKKIGVGMTFWNRASNKLETIIQDPRGGFAGHFEADDGTPLRFEAPDIVKIERASLSYVRIVGGQPLYILHDGWPSEASEMKNRVFDQQGNRVPLPEGKILDIYERGGYLDFVIQNDREVSVYSVNLSDADSSEDQWKEKKGETKVARELELLNILTKYHLPRIVGKDEFGEARMQEMAEELAAYNEKYRPKKARDARLAQSRGFERESVLKEIKDELLAALLANKNVLSWLAATLARDPKPFLETIAAVPAKGTQVQVDRFIRLLFPKYFAQKEMEARRFAAVDYHRRPEPNAEDYLAGYAETELGEADPQAQWHQEIIEMRERPPRFIVNGIYGEYRSGVWRKTELPIDPDLDEPVRQYTFKLPYLGDLRELELPRLLGGQIIPDRVKGITEAGKEVSLTAEVSESGAGRVRIPDRPIIEHILYSQRVSELPQAPDDISDKDLRMFMKEIERRYGNTLTEKMGVLPPWAKGFVHSLEGKTPLQKVEAIEMFVRSVGYYDWKNGEMKGQKVGKPFEERLALMQYRLEKLRERDSELAAQLTGQQAAGVCADFAELSAALLREAGFAAGYLEGFRSDTTQVTTGNVHGMAFVVWPSSDGPGYKIIGVDGTPGGITPEEKERLTHIQAVPIAEKKSLRGEEVNKILDSAQEDVERLVREIEQMSPEAIADLKNGDLEQKVNTVLHYTVVPEDVAVFKRLFAAAVYGPKYLREPGREKDMAWFLAGEVRAEHARPSEMFVTRRASAGRGLFDMVREYEGRLTAQVRGVSAGERRRLGLERLSQAVSMVEPDLKDREIKAIRMIVQYLKAEYMAERKEQ